MHVDKVDHVTTVDRVAERLGESSDFIHDLALKMDAEDGAITASEPTVFWHSRAAASKLSSS
jgi:hypothetical protein